MKTLKIQEVANQVRGVSYKPDDLHDSLNDSSVILLRANNIDDGKINFDDVVYVDKSKVSKEQYLKRGDILVCASSGSKQLVGKAASVDFETECTFGAFCKVVRPQEEFARYLGKYFQSNTYRSKISAVAIGANINNIRNEHIDTLDLRVYDEAKNEEVVHVISCVQSIIEHRKQEIKKLDDLIKARFVELFSQGNHKIVKASEVCDFITKGTTPPTGEITEEYGEGMIPFLKVYNLSFTGEMLFDDNPQYIPRKTHNGKLARSKVYPNDVLMNIVGPPLGKFTIVTDEYKEWNINQAIAIFRAKERILPRFLLHALMQPTVLEPFIGQAVGIRQQNLSLEQCRNLQFPLPSIEEQMAFVEFAEQTDKSKFIVQKMLEETQLLFDSLMQQYFG